MSQYKYDEEGGQFYTFLLTFLLLVLIPVTWSLLAGASSSTRSQSWFDRRGQKVSAIQALNRRSISNPQLSKRLIFAAFGWAAVAFLCRQIANSAANSSHAVYDPFNILGIATGATEKEIKKHYKRLSIKFHPDKIRLSANQTKESVESHYIELTKAYKALTDDTIRKNFELYGHPDGRQEMSMGIALPTWVVESQNNVWVLGVYGIVFGILLPYIVARWWYGSRSKTKDGLYVGTAQLFFRHLREDTHPARILSLLGVCEEFEDKKLDKRGKDADAGALDELEAAVRGRLKELGERWELVPEFRSQSVRKTLILLHAHLFRIDSKSTRLNRQRYSVAATSERLLNGMLQIALAHNWLDLTHSIMSLIQCIVQAVPFDEDERVRELLQLDGMTTSAAKQMASKGVEGISGLWRLNEAERRKYLSGVDAKQQDQIAKVAGDWPRVELLDAYFKVTGERVATTGAIVQFIVELKTISPKQDDTVLIEGVRPGKKSTGSSSVRRDDTNEGAGVDALTGSPATLDTGKETLGVARAPHFPEERKPHWWVLIGDEKQNRVIVQPTRFTDIGPNKTRTYAIQFQAPPSPGLYTFQAQVRSDSYLGCDASQNIALLVEDPATLEEADVEDDISEPEEDSLAGQMAMMRGGKVKPSAVHGDRDEDDEEESGTDDDGEEELSDSDTDAE